MPRVAVEDQGPNGYQLDHGVGYFTAPRDIASFEPLMREPNGLMARVWLLIHARVRHDPGWARGSHGSVWLERGQCVLGVREVAERLGVGKNAAARALQELERLQLISRDAGQRGSVVSVPNYGAYGDSTTQPRDSSGDSRGTAPGTAPGTAAGQLRGQPRDSDRPLTNGRTGERENGRTGERETTHTNARAPVAGVVGPGPRFAAARAAIGIGIDEAAKSLGIDVGDLAALEAGTRSPSEAEAHELEQLLRRARGEIRVGLDESRPVLRAERREVANALWGYQEQVRLRVVPDARPLKLQDLPGGPLDAVVLILATWSPADCVHALEMAAIEGEWRGSAGEDPLAYLNGRTNWKPEQFERLVQSTPAQLRARAGPGKVSKPAQPVEPIRKLKRVG